MRQVFKSWFPLIEAILYLHPNIDTLHPSNWASNTSVLLVQDIHCVGYSSLKDELHTLSLRLDLLLTTWDSGACSLMNMSTLQTGHGINKMYCIHMGLIYLNILVIPPTFP